MKSVDLNLAPAGSAIIVMQLKGVSARNGIGVTFSRRGPDEETPASLDRGPDALNLIVGYLRANKAGNWIAYAVPAGTWWLSGMGLIPHISFCLGGPGFEVGEGEVVYGGTFDLSAENFGPDLDLAAPKTWLAGRPEAAKVRAASYLNGYTGHCSGNAIYAVEVEAAPYKKGYSWGGARGKSESAARREKSSLSGPLVEQVYGYFRK